MNGSIVPDSEPEDAMLPTAVIIPFPVRPQAVEVTPEEEMFEEPRPEDRLARALASLNAALAEQKVALASWREALDALKTGTSGLGDSLRRYHASLGTLGNQVATLHDRAITMEQWADGVLSK